MPISDEIIELEPVKKSKSKLIIMFVIMGVLFALAITFLVLYLLKPNVEENTGRINEIIGETSALFVDSNGEESKNIASVNNTYTVYVDVSAEGTADPKVIWEWQPRLAIEEIGHGSVGDVVATSAEGEAEPATRFYFSFKPSAQYADGVTPVTITARSTSDQNKHTDVTFYIVNQGTENIEIQKISHDGGAYANITYNDNGQISLPYYSNDENNKIYAVSFRQLGKFNPTTGLYSDLTRQTTGKDGQPTYKVDIDTDKKDSVITNLRVVDSDPNNESFRFKLCGSGEATITLTANNYNDYSAPISVSIKIKAESTDTLGYIDDIRIYDRPVDDTNGKFYKNYVNKQYTATNYGDIPSSSKTFVMPYGVPGYNNFLQHIVLLPLSVQYNPDGTRKSDWMNHINVTSSLNDLLTITKDAQKNVVLKSNLYGADNNCTLSVTSTDKLGVIVSKAINVNIVAQNTNGTITVKKEGQSADEDVDKKISTSQGQSLNLSVTYFFTAPSDIETEGFVTSNCLSKGYTVSMKSVATEQEVKNFVLTPGSGTKAIEWNKQQSIDTSMVIAKTGPESSTRYTGTVNFKLAIPSDRDKVPDGDYFFTFTKIGTPGLVDTAGRVSELDKTWSVSFTLDVTAKARTARFISEDKGAEIARLDGNKGNFIIENDHKARLYLQNRAKGSLPVGFDFKNFVEVTDGVCTKNVACTSPTTHLNIVGSTGNQTFEFSGRKNWVDTDVQGKVTIRVKNNAEEEIGIFEIDVYLIDAIEFIVVEEKGDSTFNYNKESIASGGKSFVPDRILNDFIFRQEDDIKNDPKKKYNEAAHDNFELLSHIG